MWSLEAPAHIPKSPVTDDTTFPHLRFIACLSLTTPTTLAGQLVSMPPFYRSGN